ncbi:MAG: LapA family protein [Gemmataceae bacterium]|nr:LapA family protein [Gemmataceae bacterium]
MRLISFLLLLVLAGATALFAMQNNENIFVHFFNWGLTASLAALIGVAYLLGMLSGWSVLGVVRRSIARLADPPEHRP